VGGVASAVCWTTACAPLEAGPARPVRVVVPFPPTGAASDIVAQAIAAPLAVSLGKEVVIENRPGRAGAVGAQYVATSVPDGSVLLLASPGPNTLGPALNEVPYDPLHSFSAVSMIAQSPMLLVTAPQAPFSTVAQLLAFARDRDVPLAYGSSGAGGMPHLSMELFRHRAGLRAVHRPYVGANEALLGVMRGEVDIMFCALASGVPYISRKILKPIALALRNRIPELPEVPTLAQSGLGDLQIVNWFGLAAPGGMDPAMVQRLALAVDNSISGHETRDRFVALGFTPRSSTPEELGSHIRNEYNEWRDLVRAAPSLRDMIGTL
jgi:tripartite-type tricarboxylate transporter receptor subunit TctC